MLLNSHSSFPLDINFCVTPIALLVEPVTPAKHYSVLLFCLNQLFKELEKNVKATMPALTAAALSELRSFALVCVNTPTKAPIPVITPPTAACASSDGRLITATVTVCLTLRGGGAGRSGG